MIVRRGFGIERFGVDGQELLFVVMQRRNILLLAGGGVVLKLRVVVMQAGRGASRWGVLEVDVVEVLLCQIVEGLVGTVGGEVLSRGRRNYRETNKKGRGEKTKTHNAVEFIANRAATILRCHRARPATPAFQPTRRLPERL